MRTHVLTSIKLTVVTLFIFGFVYPLAMTGIAQLTPGSGEGQKLELNGKVVGFEVIGQNFTSDKYFNSRPSAVSYNASATGGSNKGPTNPDYLKTVEDRIAAFQKSNPGIKKGSIPVDLVTASGGGLDPHISLAAANVQVPRISKATGLSAGVLQRIITENTESGFLGLSPKGANVLKMNIAIEVELNKKK